VNAAPAPATATSEATIASHQLGVAWPTAGKYDEPAGSMKCRKRSCHPAGSFFEPVRNPGGKLTKPTRIENADKM